MLFALYSVRIINLLVTFYQVTTFLFSVALCSAWRENMQVFSSRNDYYFLILSGTLFNMKSKYAYEIFAGEMTTTIFSFFLALYLARTENLHIISSSTNIYSMKTCPKSCNSSLFGTHKKPIRNFAFQIRMTSTLFSFSHSIRHG